MNNKSPQCNIKQQKLTQIFQSIRNLDKVKFKLYQLKN